MPRSGAVVFMPRGTRVAPALDANDVIPPATDIERDRLHMQLLEDRRRALADIEQHAETQGDGLTQLLFTLYREFGYENVRRKVNSIDRIFEGAVPP